jgi:ubiquinone/menaquinone biosynthesis C-methylase UbiE
MKQIMQEQWDNIAHNNAFNGVLSTNEFENINRVDVNRFWETGRIDADSILKVIGLEGTRQLNMLEIGCGLGRMTHCFAQTFRKVSALDVSAEMLKRAAHYWKHLKKRRLVARKRKGSLPSSG